MSNGLAAVLIVLAIILFFLFVRWICRPSHGSRRRSSSSSDDWFGGWDFGGHGGGDGGGFGGD